MSVIPAEILADREIHVPSPYEGKRLSFRQNFAISSFWFASNFMWGALLPIVLPTELARINPLHKAQALGALTGIAAFVPLIVPLIAGALSDRCASPFGRRRPYILAGTLVNVIGLVLMYFASHERSFWLFLPAYCVVQLGNNVATAPYAGLIPDLVPDNQRGIASGYMAVMSQLGTLAGALIAGQLIHEELFGTTYLLLGAVLTGFMFLTVYGITECPLGQRPPKLRIIPYLKSLWISPKKYPDFAWVWLTRALVMMGFYAVQPFAQYYLADVIGVTNPPEAVSYVLGLVLVGAIASGYFGGAISDRIGRKRVVYIANTIIAVMTIALIFCDTMLQVTVVAALFGIGYGAYISVDWALGTDVLPSRRDAAKDMAVWHISMALPQSIAPPITGMLLGAFGSHSRFDEQTGEWVFHYTHAGYTAMLLVAAVLFALGAFFLRNVKKAR